MNRQPNKDKRSNSQDRNIFRGLAYFSQITVTLITTVLVSVFIGKYLDTKFNTSPWLLLVSTLLGIAAAIMNLFYMGKR
ncbi:MAG: AtpZ/AtpI family protein [Tissierellia bacterium]|nr:AtpZ/AtpI family protein [Tissierellia bacterium]